MKVSVITPSYNQGHLIEQTILSVLNQNYPDVEMIIVDGKSTDETLTILEKYSERISWTSEPDSGQSDAINKGIKRATGDIVCFLNSDDTLEPEALSKVVKFFAINPNFRWVYGRCRIIDLDNKVIRRPITLYKNIVSRKYSYKKLLIENYISQPAAFWKSEIHEEFGYFDESENYVMDYEFWCRIGKRYKAGVIKHYLANFRMYETSKSGSLQSAQFEDELRVARKYASGNKLIVLLHSINKTKIVYSYKLMKIISNFKMKK